MMSPFEEGLRADLEREGVASVRRRQQAGHLGGDGRGLEITLQWLREKDAEERADQSTQSAVSALERKKEKRETRINAFLLTILGALLGALATWLLTRH